MIHPKLSETLHDVFGAPVKSGDLGIELEIEGENLPITELTGWTVKSETSLRGKNGRQVSSEENLPDTPREYVLRSPASMVRMKGRLETLCAALKQTGVSVNLTTRASTHIHLNMGPETLGTFFAFLLVYVTVEPLLLRLCGDQRNGNLFCLPTYESGDLGQFIRGVFTQMNKPTGHPRQWRNRGKYGALNTDPVQSLGSVEIRCFPNSVNQEEIFGWCSWVMSMKELAAAHNTAPYKELMDKMYSEPAWLIKSIFGDAPVYQAAGSVHPHELVRYGYELAYECWKKMGPMFDYKEPEPPTKKVSAPAFDSMYIDQYSPTIFMDAPSNTGDWD